MVAKEIQFDASDIEISNDQNLTIANNGIAIIKDDGLVIEGAKIKYFKDKLLIVVNDGEISKIDKTLKINSNSIEYYIDDGKINFSNKVKINDYLKNLIIKTKNIKYDKIKKLIIGQENTEILDEFDNIYKVNEFEYSFKDKIIKLKNAKVLIKMKYFDTELLF